MIKRFLNKLLEKRFVIRIIAVLRQFHPWGFEGLSLFAVMRYFFEGVQKGALSTRAAAITFRIFVAVFPMLMVLIAIIPFVPIENFKELLFDNISGFFPGDTFNLIDDTLTGLMEKHNDILGFGTILLLYYASNSVNAILQGFNGSYNLEKRGNPLILRAASLVLMLVLSFLIVLSMSMIVFSGKLFDYLLEVDLLPSKGVVVVLDVLKWLISVFLIYMSISILYNAGDFRRRRWKTFSAGASFATLFFILASIVFAWFVNSLANFETLYGTVLGTMLILLIWMNFNSMILLLGFELNTSIFRAKRTLESQLEQEKLSEE